MNRVQRDTRGRPVQQVAIKTQTKEETRKDQLEEKNERLSQAARAVALQRKAHEEEARVVKSLLEALRKSGRTCAECAACDVRVVGYCSSLAARGSLPEWDGIISMPGDFGCALWRGKR